MELLEAGAARLARPTAIPSSSPAASASASRWPARWPSSRVLLLDEPFGALDAKVRKELRLNGGKIAQYAAPKEIEASPADDFVREFLA
jgi:hypothetical protein